MTYHQRKCSTRVTPWLFQLALPVVMLMLYSTGATAQVIKVSQPAWLGLSPVERSQIQSKYVIDLAEQDAFGIIIDNQGVNESTSGTTAGAHLGGAVANAAYVDNALKTGNYSAKNQLAVGLLGAILGSSLDSKPNAQFHFRYAVRLGSGNVKYFDEVQNNAFRHPVGICVSVPNIAPIDQHLCSQTADQLRAAYLSMPPPPPPPTATATSAPAQANDLTVAQQGTQLQEQVYCKLGTLAPVRTSAEKCHLIQGSIVQ